MEVSESQHLGSSTKQLAMCLDELVEGVVSEILEEVTHEMDRMSAAERAGLLAQVLREAGR